MPLQSSSYFVKKQGSGSAKRNLETGAGSAFFQGRIAWALDGLKADPSGITGSLAIGEVTSALICVGVLGSRFLTE